MLTWKEELWDTVAKHTYVVSGVGGLVSCLAVEAEGSRGVMVLVA